MVKDKHTKNCPFEIETHDKPTLEMRRTNKSVDAFLCHPQINLMNNEVKIIFFLSRLSNFLVIEIARERKTEKIKKVKKISTELFSLIKIINMPTRKKKIQKIVLCHNKTRKLLLPLVVHARNFTRKEIVS